MKADVRCTVKEGKKCSTGFAVPTCIVQNKGAWYDRLTGKTSLMVFRDGAKAEEFQLPLRTIYLGAEGPMRTRK